MAYGKSLYHKQPAQVIKEWMRAADRIVKDPVEKKQLHQMLEHFHRQVLCHGDHRDTQQQLMDSWRLLEMIANRSDMWKVIQGDEALLITSTIGIDKLGIGQSVRDYSAWQPKDFFAAVIQEMSTPNRYLSNADVLIILFGARYLMVETARDREVRDQKAILHTWKEIQKLLTKVDMLTRYRADQTLRGRILGFLKGG